MHRQGFAVVALIVVFAAACSSDETGSDPTGSDEVAASSSIDADAATTAGSGSEPMASHVPADTAGESTASVEDFCAAISAIQSAEFALEETFGPEARALFEDVQAAAPPDVADDVAIVVAALEAVAAIGISTDENDPVAFDAAAEILLDPAFTDANVRLEGYTSEACGIDLDDGSDADVELDDLAGVES